MNRQLSWSPRVKAVGYVFALVVLFAFLCMWFVIASQHAFAANADGGTVVLEGAALAHGNVLLHGWSLSLDSFWSVDVLFYALEGAVLGVGPIAMHLVPAVLAACCVFVGLRIAFVDQTLRVRLIACWLVVVGLCLPGHAMANFLLQGPWHVATTLYCLVAIALLRANHFGWRWSIAVVVLTLGLCGDLQMLAIGIVPIALAGVLAMIRCRSLRSGLVAFAAAATASVGALVVRVVTQAIGTFRVSESHHTVKAAQLVRDIGNFGNWYGSLMGIHRGSYGGPAIPVGFAVLRALVVVLVVAGFLGALVSLIGELWRGPSADLGRDDRAEPWRIDDLLLCCSAGAVGLFGLLTLSNNTSYARYLDPVVIFSIVLAARVVPRWWAHRSAITLRIGAVLMAAIVATSSVTAVQAATRAEPVAPTAALESFLAHHHLRLGIGDYWASSIVTVDTHQQIVVRPVVANLRGLIVPDGRQASIGWYTNVHFEFLVYQRKPYGRVNPAAVLRSFGRPLHAYVVGTYHVLTWDHPLVLRSPPFP